MFGNRVSKHRQETIVVHTKDGQSFRGVMAGDYRDVIVLAHAVLMGEQGNDHPLPGEQLIPWVNVAFLQTGLPA